MDSNEARAREILESECGTPLPMDVPVVAAHAAVVAALRAFREAPVVTRGLYGWRIEFADGLRQVLDSEQSASAETARRLAAALSALVPVPHDSEVVR